MLEFVRTVGCHFIGFCCSECDPKAVYIYNLDTVLDPMQISERLAPGREVKIANPVLDADDDVRVEDPASLIFPVVRPRCFVLGCESEGPMLKCSRCHLITYCTKVSFCTWQPVSDTAAMTKQQLN